MARAGRRGKRASSGSGRDYRKIALIAAFTFGALGVYGVDEIAGKVFFLLIAALVAFLYWRKYIARTAQSSKGESAARPLQQFQYQPVHKATNQPAEFINSAGHRQGNLYELVPVRVVGVTFKNGRRHRQTILRQIYWKDEPYDGEVAITLQQGEYEGQPTVEVWANNEQIGFVPKEQVPFFVDNWHCYHSAFDLEVSGGGKRPDGERVPYGASFVARFTRSSEVRP